MINLILMFLEIVVVVQPSKTGKAMQKQLKLGFVIVPKKATEEEVGVYLRELKDRFPNCVTMVSALPVNGYAPGINVPFLDSVIFNQHKQGVSSRCYEFLTHMRSKELDYMFFNLATKRYSVEVFEKFVRCALREKLRADLVIGSPILDQSSSSNAEQLLDVPIGTSKIKQRMLVDTFINYVLSKKSDRSRCMNVNSCMFGIRHTRSLLNTLLCVDDYDDSSLVCSQFAWHLSRTEDSCEIHPIRVDNIDLTQLGFSLERSVAEIGYIFKMIRRFGVGINAKEMVGQFFAPWQPDNWGYRPRWIRPQPDSDWFYTNIAPRIAG